MTPLVDEEDGEPLRQRSVALALLSESTVSAYNSTRNSILKMFPSASAEQLPSYHMLTKVRPKIKGFTLDSIKLDTQNLILDTTEDLQECQIDAIIDEMTRKEREVTLRIEPSSDIVLRLEEDFNEGKKLKKNYCSKSINDA